MAAKIDYEPNDICVLRISGTLKQSEFAVEQAALAGKIDVGAKPRLLVILEDYHLIETAEIHRTLTYWLDHAPPNVMLVLTARADPPFPRARLRARGQLTEIRAADLRRLLQIEEPSD